MPLGIALILIDLIFIVHAAKTGRFQPWGYLILVLAGIGVVAYILVELLPEWMSGVQGQKARRRVVNALDPEKEYRKLSDDLEISDTIANRTALAEECLALEKFEEARRHYENVLGRPMGDEPGYALSKAEAEFASAARRMRSQPSTGCGSAGPTTNRPTVTCSMPARSRKAAAPGRRSTNIGRWPTTTRAPKRVSAWAPCSPR
jgi:hypothetical protein